MTRRLLKYIGWGFITAAGYRVTRGYNETRPPVCLKVNSVSFIDFFRSDFVQESRFEGFYLATRVARLTLKKTFFDQISNYSII